MLCRIAFIYQPIKMSVWAAEASRRHRSCLFCYCKTFLESKAWEKSFSWYSAESAVKRFQKKRLFLEMYLCKVHKWNSIHLLSAGVTTLILRTETAKSKQIKPKLFAQLDATKDEWSCVKLLPKERSDNRTKQLIVAGGSDVLLSTDDFHWCTWTFLNFWPTQTENNDGKTYIFFREKGFNNIFIYNVHVYDKEALLRWILQSQSCLLPHFWLHQLSVQWENFGEMLDLMHFNT